MHYVDCMLVHKHSIQKSVCETFLIQPERVQLIHGCIFFHPVPEKAATQDEFLLKDIVRHVSFP